MRDAENTLREERDLPLVGEGWISETDLYYRLRAVFKEEVVIHHGRPAWIGYQHLDIFFPERRIAIEYQGAQHDRPIDFFGGIEAYEATQRRDKPAAL
jgi:hypothetical protein